MQSMNPGGVKPWLWLTSSKSDFRILEFMDVPDIIAQGKRALNTTWPGG